MLKAIFGDQMRLTVNLTVKFPRDDERSKPNNALLKPFMIEWE